MVKKLPMFNGYTVDIELKQFRKVIGDNIRFLDFNTEKGEIVLSEYIKSLDTDCEEFEKIMDLF
jgi:hypothetical protein